MPLDVLPLLDELRTIAQNGLAFATNPYDRERYERLFALACHYYGQALNLPPAAVRQRLAAELGYITPKVGANAAIFNAAGEILLVQRADDHCWCLPCGWIDPGETPAAAAVREVREETGLTVRPVRLVDVFTRLPSAAHGPHTQVAILYLCVVTGGTLACSHESLAVDWWPVAAVPVWHHDHAELARTAHAVWQAGLSATEAG